MKVFWQIRKPALLNSEIIHRFDEMEKKYDEQFSVVFSDLRYMINQPEKERKKLIIDNWLLAYI